MLNIEYESLDGVSNRWNLVTGGADMKTRYVWIMTVLLLFPRLGLAAEMKSICDVQQYIGVHEGDVVRVSGVVIAYTGRYGYGVTIIAENGDPWCGIAIVDSGISTYGPYGEEPCTQGAPRYLRFNAAIGQCLTVEGEVWEYYDSTQVRMYCEAEGEDTLFYEVSDDCFDVPPPRWVPTGDVMQEENEWTLVEIWCATAVTEPDDDGMFTVDDGSGPCTVLGTSSWPGWDPQLGTFFCRLTGILNYTWDRFSLRPRTMDDVDLTPMGECAYCDVTATPTTPVTPTSTPTPNQTPQATATPTEEPTPRPTPPPTDTPAPTATRSPTFSPTELPPSATPAPTTTDTPTPTPARQTGVNLTLNAGMFHPGQQFILQAVAANGSGTVLSANLFVFLDIGTGTYWFWPTWAEYPPAVDYQEITLAAGDGREVGILNFVWPDTGAAAMSGIAFWGAMTDGQITTVIGQLDHVMFGFGPE